MCRWTQSPFYIVPCFLNLLRYNGSLFFHVLFVILMGYHEKED